MDGGKARSDSYLTAPGLRQSFEKAGISHESYLTGQCAFLFTKMLIKDKLNLKGVFPPEALDADARAYFLQEAAKFELIVDEVLQRRLF
jgi:saccharopine dehydrogenase-like NADP-dependent oxidoreductase